MVFLSKRLNLINGNDFIRMMEKGAQQLRDNVDKVNALNVFPVPDGDTGTNMNLTLTSGVEELSKRPSAHIGKAADALAKGLLMGARGNSGVILSQLFRGFAKSVSDAEAVDAEKLAAALQSGVDMAYKAVVKPVEGTILTVSREAAKHAVQQAKRTHDLVELMKETWQKGQEALSRTPEMLPVLKQVGVVDAGGQGLLYIYEGFVQALQLLSAGAEAGDGAAGPYAGSSDGIAAPDEPAHREAARPQAKLATEDIEFGYCTEFMVRLNPVKTAASEFDEGLFRKELSAFGDSLLVVADDDLVKVHIHAEYPGSVMNLAMKYGDLSRIKIENMRDQHTHLLHEGNGSSGESQSDGGTSAASSAEEAGRKLKPYGFVAVAAGQGIAGIFASLGVDRVLQGGQTMNPSTEDIVTAIREVHAHTVFVFPNNSNIILAAQQAVELVEDKQVIVVPAKTIPQGIAAVIAYNEHAAPDENEDAMKQAIQQVQSGLVTCAVRDTRIDEIDIKQGDYIGIYNHRIVVSHPDLLASCRGLIDHMLAGGAGLVTFYTGEEADEEQTGLLVDYVEQTHGDVEVEVHYGGQPLYYYMISAE
ncbi:DAK2 domain protein [Paenibacillus konkukensis]|uniref:DAK2 domain protein n=1 Tax=Paenibacillus konkukensis TaxID=2020716 RepID=A0ABY4RZY6_9BACL|nr:DAK2 domain-containing protein [Paenibacillus konkukensis]UQZ87260.1 DAK2 domain protein [Paenibacillus konkukensis]